MVPPLRPISCVLVGCLLGCDSAPVPPPAPAATFPSTRAQELAREGYYTEAARLLRSLPPPAGAAEQSRHELEIARMYLRANVPDQALPAAKAALELGSKEDDAYYIEAEAMRRLRLAGAEEKLQTLLSRAPGHLQASLALAQIRMHSGEPASALPLFDAYFRGARPDDRDYTSASLEHARALHNAGRYQEAADRHVRLLEQDPLEGACYSGLAQSLYRLKLRQEGRFIEEIYRLISRDSFEEHVEDRLRETGNTAFAEAQRGVNRTRQRRYLEAFHHYRRALELDRGDGRLRVLFAELAIQFRRLPEARAALVQAIEAGMKPLSGLHWMLGRVALEEERFGEAAASFEGAIAALNAEGDLGGSERGQAPRFSALLSLARSRVETRAVEPARQAAQEARMLAPSSWEPSYWLGRAALVSGETQEALALLAEASQKGASGVADVSLHEAAALARSGRTAEAAARLNALIAANPNLLPAHEELARITSDPAAEAALAQCRAGRDEVRRVEARLQGVPLAECGPIYLELGKLHVNRREPRAFEYLFLACDLLPQSAEACKLLLSGLRQSQDVFVRLRYLRRLHALEPRDPAVLGQLATIYLKLHVRLDDAASFAGELHQIKPTPDSFRLLIQAASLRGDGAGAQALKSEALAAFPESAELRALSLPSAKSQ